MRALMLQDYGRLVVTDTADPIAGAGEIILETVATGICGSDIHGYTGENGRRLPGQIMGHESVGRIHSVGPGVDAGAYPIGATATFNPVIVSAEGAQQYRGREQHDPGRKVIGVEPSIVAAFAERFAVPAGNVVVLPDTMPVAFGSLIEPLAVSLHAVRRIELQPGESVLIVGGGPIGQSLVLAALREGAAAVYVSELNQERRDLCARLGATVIDPAAHSVPEHVTRLHGGPVDVAIDAVGITESLADALGSTSFGGRVCLVGMGSPRVELGAFSVSTAERVIVGSFTYSFDTFTEAAHWVGEGDPIFASLISEEVALEEADDAFQRLVAGRIPAKALIRFDREPVAHAAASSSASRIV